MEFSVMFAGTAGAVRILIDCGEGTQRQLLRSGGLSDLTDIFITHLHVDHWLGLPGLLQTFNLRDRDRPLAIHGPPGSPSCCARCVACTAGSASHSRWSSSMPESPYGATRSRSTP